MRKKPFKCAHINTIKKLYEIAHRNKKIRYNSVMSPILDSSKEHPITCGEKFYLKTWNYQSRRYYYLSDRSRVFEEFLDTVRINYTTGNDAPRGGAEGDYVQILTKIRY